MPLLLMELGAHPGEIPATKVAACLQDGAFFLDFSRPLGRLRWFGMWNRWIGFSTGLRVPVVHQGERAGSHLVAVTRVDPYYKELQRLWATRYPRPQARDTPAHPTAADRIAADFLAQFPDDAAQGAHSH